MFAKPVAGDEPSEPLRYAVALHVLMSQAEMELWERVAERRRLEIDDAVHAAALGGLKDQLAHDGDELAAHVAGGCERELRARLGLKAV
jgi:hypothetical protein